MHGFRFYFTLHLESFSPFPRGTSSLSVTREYLALRDGPRRFPPDFTCPAVLGCPEREPTRFRLQDYHLLWFAFPYDSASVLVDDSPACALWIPQPLRTQACSGLGCSPFARRYWGNRVFFLFLGVLRCLTSPRWLRSAYAFSGRWRDMTPVGLPHSEIPGSKTVCVSPGLIAACRVLHRLLVPRHPPCALSSLTGKYD